MVITDDSVYCISHSGFGDCIKVLFLKKTQIEDLLVGNVPFFTATETVTN